MDAGPAPLAQVLEKVLGPDCVLMWLVAVGSTGDQEQRLVVEAWEMAFEAFVRLGIAVGVKFAPAVPALVADALEAHAKGIRRAIGYPALRERSPIPSSK